MELEMKQIRELVHLIDSSSIAKLSIVTEKYEIKIDKNAAKPEPKYVPYPAEAVQTAQTAPAPDEPITILPETRAAQKAGNYITSPVVGTFYASPAPGKPPLVSVGSKVKKGDAVCIIETMKVMNEIQSQFDGEIAEILAQNDKLVEFGQQLFRVV